METGGDILQLDTGDKLFTGVSDTVNKTVEQI
jgi:hypothetical protein